MSIASKWLRQRSNREFRHPCLSEAHVGGCPRINASWHRIGESFQQRKRGAVPLRCLQARLADSMARGEWVQPEGQRPSTAPANGRLLGKKPRGFGPPALSIDLSWSESPSATSSPASHKIRTPGSTPARNPITEGVDSPVSGQIGQARLTGCMHGAHGGSRTATWLHNYLQGHLFCEDVP
jgi:hypothetical protein